MLAGQPGKVRRESGPYYLKGLHLLLDTFARDEMAARPDFVPTIDAFMSPCMTRCTPLNTGVMLMRYYEQTGEFSKAEDRLFAMIEVRAGQRGTA